VCIYIYMHMYMYMHVCVFVFVCVCVHAFLPVCSLFSMDCLVFSA